MRDNGAPYDVFVVSYDSYKAEDTWFKSRRWCYIVLDEGHKIKNHKTQISTTLQGISSLYKLSGHLPMNP